MQTILYDVTIRFDDCCGGDFVLIMCVCVVERGVVGGGAVTVIGLVAGFLCCVKSVFFFTRGFVGDY